MDRTTVHNGIPQVFLRYSTVYGIYMRFGSDELAIPLPMAIG